MYNPPQKLFWIQARVNWAAVNWVIQRANGTVLWKGSYGGMIVAIDVFFFFTLRFVFFMMSYSIWGWCLMGSSYVVLNYCTGLYFFIACSFLSSRRLSIRSSFLLFLHVLFPRVFDFMFDCWVTQLLSLYVLCPLYSHFLFFCSYYSFVLLGYFSL